MSICAEVFQDPMKKKQERKALRESHFKKDRVDGPGVVHK
jgi:hypothetical protein